MVPRHNSVRTLLVEWVFQYSRNTRTHTHLSGIWSLQLTCCGRKQKHIQTLRRCRFNHQICCQWNLWNVQKGDAATVMRCSLKSLLRILEVHKWNSVTGSVLNRPSDKNDRKSSVSKASVTTSCAAISKFRTLATRRQPDCCLSISIVVMQKF